VSRDGRHFAVVAPPPTSDAAPADALTLVVNWPADLKDEG
jgi:hypothetical protein